VVFELDNPKSPYWRGIGKNIRLIDGLGEDNLLGRKLLALYRHPDYSLDQWKDYAGFLGGEIG
jgi:hypothetical protein